jgi:hypothetical protein
MKNWWVPSKNFKMRASDDYLTILLMPPYKYVVEMLCKVYGEIYA